MESVSRHSGAFFNHYLNPFNPDQTLSERVFKVFLYGLGIMLLWVVTRPKSQETDLNKPIEGKLWVYIPTTGAIGKDQHHRFGETLTLTNGDPLQVMATDLYVTTKIKIEDQWAEKQLPSSLFSQTCLGDQISFRQEGQLYKLTLHGREGSTFDQDLEAVKRYWDQSRDEFFYPEDVPDSYKRWSMRGHPVPIYLSPETKQVRVGEKGATPVDFSLLQRVSTLPHAAVQAHLMYAGIKDRVGEYAFSAVGEDPRITILVDRHHLYVHHYCKMSYGTYEEVIDNIMHVSLFFDKDATAEFFDKDATADYENIEAQLLASGVLRVIVPFLPNT